MTFSLAINLVTIFLCVAVLVQSVRMMRSIARMQSQDLRQLVAALDTAAANAGVVLGELKTALKGDATQVAERLRESKSIQEELGMLVGISNAMAERLLETADEARKICNAPTPAPAAPAARPARKAPEKTASKTSAKTGTKTAAKTRTRAAAKSSEKKSASPAKSAASTRTATAKAGAAGEKAATKPAAKSTRARKAPARTRSAQKSEAGTGSKAPASNGKPAERMALA